MITKIILTIGALYLILVLSKDFDSWVIKDLREKFRKNSQKINALEPADFRVFAILVSWWFTTMAQLMFAAYYLWVAMMIGHLWPVGVGLAGLQVVYVLRNTRDCWTIKMPETFPDWYRWTVLAEAVFGMPCLIFVVYKLIGG